MRRLSTTLLAIGALALLVGGLRSAVGANSGSFTDPLGDYKGGSPDVIGGTIANDDSGLITVKINFADGRPFETGMRAGVLYDVDANSATGDTSTGFEGTEYWLYVARNEGWTFLVWNGSSWVSGGTPASVSVTTSATSAQFSINRSAIGNTSKLRYWVFGNWAANAGTDFDFAPDVGAYDFTVLLPSTTTTTTATTTAPSPNPTPTPTPTPNPGVTPASTVDTDKDGLIDTKDACPKTRAGQYDKNNNGCPGPFKSIPLPALRDISPRRTFQELTWWEQGDPAKVGGLPAGAQVQLKVPTGVVVNSGGKPRRVSTRWVFERGRANSGGVFRSKLLLRGNKFLNREAIELRVWKPGWIGYSVAMVIRTRAPLLVFGSRSCIPPTSSAPRPCKRVGSGS